jgi:hypothetical protein
VAGRWEIEMVDKLADIVIREQIMNGRSHQRRHKEVGAAAVLALAILAFD